MTGNAVQSSGQIEPFPKNAPTRAMSENLGQLRDMLRSEFPEAAAVTLSFDGTLKAHIDVRKSEEVMLIEARLASLAGGAFTNIRRGPANHSAFLHRVSTQIQR